MSVKLIIGWTLALIPMALWIYSVIYQNSLVSSWNKSMIWDAVAWFSLTLYLTLMMLYFGGLIK